MGKGHWNRKLRPLVLDSYLTVTTGKTHLSLANPLYLYDDNLDERNVKLELYLAS